MQTQDLQNNPSEESLRKRECNLLYVEITTLTIWFAVVTFASKQLSTELEKLDNLSANEADWVANAFLFFALLIVELGFRYHGNKLAQQRIDYRFEEITREVNGLVESLERKNQAMEGRIQLLEQKLSRNTS